MIKEIWKFRNVVTFLGVIFTIMGMYFCFVDMVDYAIVMLIFAGICDAFDGTIAKKIDNKNGNEYGVQLDSLADICASGLLPVIICMTLGYTSIINVIVYVVFIICGITRLTYYNIKSSEENSFNGIPITSSVIVIPLIYLFLRNEIAFMATLVALAGLFVTDIKIKKPTMTIKIILSVLGILFVICLILFKYFKIKIW